MAEKHKSKYKAPKDEAKSQKPQVRKSIKDYVGEDAPNMVPGGVKGVQPNVPRKYATDVIDNIENMVPEIKDRLYKKIEEGDYSADHARKVFEKLQIEDTEGYLDAMENGVYDIKESVSKLSESQKEKLVRMYIRNKIVKVLKEQADPTADPTAELPTDPTMPPADTTPTDPSADAAPTDGAVEEPTGNNIESATKTFEDALKDEFLANASTGTEKALQPLMNHYDKNNDQKSEIAQAISNVLRSKNIILPAASSTDHTKNDEPDKA